MSKVKKAAKARPQAQRTNQVGQFDVKDGVVVFDCVYGKPFYGHLAGHTMPMHILDRVRVAERDEIVFAPLVVPCPDLSPSEIANGEVAGVSDRVKVKFAGGAPVVMCDEHEDIDDFHSLADEISERRERAWRHKAMREFREGFGYEDDSAEDVEEEFAKWYADWQPDK
jgi:hypothetical protein